MLPETEDKAFRVACPTLKACVELWAEERVREIANLRGTCDILRKERDEARRMFDESRSRRDDAENALARVRRTVEEYCIAQTHKTIGVVREKKGYGDFTKVTEACAPPPNVK